MTQDPLTLYKLIVLYMLNKVKFKLTYAQISEFILEKEYTNFLTLQEVISDLQDTELIKPDTLMNRTYFSITDEGRNTLTYFGNRIGDAIKHDIDSYLDEKHLELKNEASITADYYKSTSGEYEARLIAREKDVELVNIKLSVPTAEMAVSICDSWQKKNQKIYQYLMQDLFSPILTQAHTALLSPHMRPLTIRQHLTKNTLSTCNINIIIVIFLKFF